jgi:hypothetical protein
MKRGCDIEHATLMKGIKIEHSTKPKKIAQNNTYKFDKVGRLIFIFSPYPVRARPVYMSHMSRSIPSRRLVSSQLPKLHLTIPLPC